MTRYTKTQSGKYIIKGKKYDMLFGSRASVYHNNAYKTVGELTKSDLMMNKNGRIVSKKKHNTAKREKRLVKAGYLTRKGHFGFIKKGKGKKGGGHLEPGSYPGSIGNNDSTAPGTVFPTTLGGKRRNKTRKHRGGSHISGSLAPSSYPFGKNDDPNSSLGASQQDLLAYPNNTPQDLALLKSGGSRRRKRKGKRGGTGSQWRNVPNSTGVQMRAGYGN